MTTYAETVARWDEVRAARTAEQERHEAERDRLTTELRDLERQMHVMETLGEDAGDDVLAGRALIEVRWDRGRGGGPRLITAEVSSCFIDAVEDLRHGGPRLRERYFGVKAYDRWSSQREDHSYGMGPAHGHIWFRIGLRHPREDLTTEQMQTAIRYLRAVLAHHEVILP